MDNPESEFRCINCDGETFRRVPTEVTMGDRKISGLVDLQCTGCGELRPMGPLLPRIETLLKEQGKGNEADESPHKPTEEMI